MGAGYKANLVAAGESDSRLEARLQQQQAAFGALSLDHAVAQMPRLQARPWLHATSPHPPPCAGGQQQACRHISTWFSTHAKHTQREL